MPKKAPTSLDKYRAKRKAGATPEPFGGEGFERPGLFVVQQHDASRMHFDLRLEIDGVMKSWAVPKGPSLDPDDKRLAVMTEDHPMEYADFEGVIPEGNYGAGAMIVWDHGRCVQQLDPDHGLEEGKLLFDLYGYKLRGRFTLVKTSRGEKEWLLIKKPDGGATGETVDELDAASVFSGLTVEELGQGADREAEIEARLEELGAPRRRLDAAKVKPMLAQLQDEPFSHPDWIFELKYDGYRVLASVERGKGGRPVVRLAYRSGRDSTAIYPDLVRALSALPYDHLVLDGEVVVLDELARPSFGLLQQRARLTNPYDAERASVALPAAFFCFDLLGFGDFDLRPLPLVERKELLRQIVPAAGPVRFADHLAERGEALYEQVRAAGVEGIVAKRADAPYRGGRSAKWIKVRAERTGDFAVVGYTQPKGTRSGFGALHLAVLHGPRLVYAGRVGSGFSERQLEEIRAQLDTALTGEPAFDNPPRAAKTHRWVEPRLVAEVKFTEYTSDDLLRHPVFVRLRTDKRIEDCTRDDLPPPELEDAEGKETTPAPRPEVEITRPRKVFWPEEGYTKGDLIAYYREISPWLLPYLEDRPLVLDRYPDGIEGKSFFQKNAPDFAPDWLRQEVIWSEEAGKESRYFICDDLESLTYLINSGAIPLHVWGSRYPNLQRPDWSILDLDAKDAPFAQAVETAREVGEVCRAIELDGFVKTSGASGLHVLFPLGGELTFDQSRQLAELLARLVAARRPEIASVARMPASRAGKVYLDYLQNGYGKLLVAPFSARPLPGAPVSMPLEWRELGPKLDPLQFTIASAPKRLKRKKKEPLAPVLSGSLDLARVLAGLAELMAEASL